MTKSQIEYHTFSVVITTYKRVGLLAKAIESVFQQNYPKDKYEVTVIYTPSGDGTEELLERYQGTSPVPVSAHQETSRSVARARNLGVEKSRLEFVAQLDDDAIACPDWLATFNRVINKHHALVVGGRIELYFDQGCKPPDWFNTPYIHRFFGLNYGEKGRQKRVVRSRYPMTLYAHNTVYARRLFDHFGGYRTDLGMDGKSFKFWRGNVLEHGAGSQRYSDLLRRRCLCPPLCQPGSDDQGVFPQPGLLVGGYACLCAPAVLWL